ncbi:MAG TPA: hypothetical protein DGK91_12205 [Clostridium sp.]|mgnify:CR=1 FL=1|nr:hypothetical protein [Clostridium sp.]
MIQVFCGKRGSGKSKRLISMANESVNKVKGNIVYIDDDKRPMLELDRRIRFVATDDFNLTNYKNIYGFLCGMLSKDYDIEAIFIDGLFNIVSGNASDAAHLFLELEKLSTKFDLKIYININSECEEVPDFIKKYAA